MFSLAWLLRRIWILLLEQVGNQYHVDVKIKDGEILVSGSTVMLGYFENEEMTKQKVVMVIFIPEIWAILIKMENLVVVGRRITCLYGNGTKCVLK